MIKRGLFATALGGRGRGGPRRFGLHGRAVVMEVLGAVRLSASSRKTPVDEVILGKTGGRPSGRVSRRTRTAGSGKSLRVLRLRDTCKIRRIAGQSLSGQRMMQSLNRVFDRRRTYACFTASLALALPRSVSQRRATSEPSDSRPQLAVQNSLARGLETARPL